MADEAKKAWDSDLNDMEKHQMRVLSRAIAGVLCKNMKENLPEEGPFERQFVCFEVMWTKTCAYMAAEGDTRDKNKLRVCLMAARDDSDYVMKEYLFKGSKDEVIEFLQRDELHEQLYDMIGEMLREWDEKMDEYPFGATSSTAHQNKNAQFDYGAAVERFLREYDNLPRENGIDALKPKYLIKAREHYKIPESDRFIYTYKADAIDSLAIYPHQRFYFTNTGIYANCWVGYRAMLPCHIRWETFVNARIEKASGIKGNVGTVIKINDNDMVLKWMAFPSPSAANKWNEFYINLQQYLKNCKRDA